MRLTPFDVLILGVLVYVLIRMALRKRGNGNAQGPTRPDLGRRDGAPDQPRDDQHQDPRREAAQAYERAQRAWDMLRDASPGKRTAPGAATGFDEEEFLAGAKAMCARIRQSWDGRDLDDLAQFCTPEMMEEFSRRATTETRSPRSEPLLIEAGLVERVAREDQTEEASVFYRVLEKLPGSGENRETREIWRYVRSTAKPGDMWRLAGMQPVDDAGDRPQ